MKIIAGIYRFAWHSAILFVIIAILMTPQEPTNALIVSLLILIVLLQSVNSRSDSAARKAKELTDYTRFLALRAALGQPSTSEEIEARSKFVNEVPPGFWMQEVFSGLACIAAIARIGWAVIAAYFA